MPRSWILALGIALLAAAWMASGYVTRPAATAEPASTSVPATATLQKVRVASFDAVDSQHNMALQGRTAPDRAVVISAQIDGRLKALHVDRGDPVTAGMALADIDIEDRKDRLAEARALLAQRQMEFNAANKLSSRGFQSEVKLAETRAALESARAAVERADIEVSYTHITAPTDGFVLARLAEQGSFVDRGDPLLQIVDLDPIKILASIPESAIGSIAPGQPALVSINNFPPLHGALSFIAPQADPATRTFEIEVQLPNPDGQIKAGLTAQLTLAIEVGHVHRIPPSILTLDSDGALGVMSVDDQNIVRFMPVELIGNADDGIEVTGLPPHIRLIVVGQDFVNAGQQVEPVEGESLPGRPGIQG